MSKFYKKFLLFLCFFIFVFRANAGIIKTQVSYRADEVKVYNNGKYVKIPQCKNILNGAFLFPAQDFFVSLPPSGLVTKITLSSYQTSFISNTLDYKNHIRFYHQNLNRIVYIGEKWINGKNMGHIRVFPIKYEYEKAGFTLFTNLNFIIRYRVTKRKVI